MRDLPFSCRCGALRGVLRDAAPRNGCHAVCYCTDCRAFARHLGVADTLEPGGGSALFQTVPNLIDITQGTANLACLRLSPKGMHRWYAACCNTPLANTTGSSRMPFAGLSCLIFDDVAPLGPIVVRGFTKHALPGAGAPKKDRGMARMVGGLVRRSLATYMAGTARTTPFFTPEGRPVVCPRILSAEEIRAAHAGG